MTHLKRQKVPKSWPVYRKGTAYVVRPNLNGVPILIILRDVLKVAQNRKEVKKSIHARNILLNNKPVKDEKNCAILFDTISIIPSKENYRISLSKKGKLTLQKISESESNKKIAKIIDKKILKGKKIQLNLSGGMNVLSEEKYSTNDSVLMNLKEKKIEKCIPLKEKAKTIIIAGKHKGEQGIIKKLDNKMATVDLEGKDTQVLIKQMMAIE